MSDLHDVIIIGSGPAGYTAAVYAARANLRPLVLAGMLEAGGDLMKTTEVENFPGFPEGIMGPDLMARLEAQAERFGARILFEDVASVDLPGEVKTVTTADGDTHRARTVIIATGSAYRTLGLPEEQALSGRGISWCATCDGSFFEGRDVAVVGGGDSALEEALFLTKYAASVNVIVRGPRLRASKVMAERALAHEKISFIFETEVAAVASRELANGTGREVVGIKTVDILGRIDHLPVSGVFIAIGSDPRTALVEGQLELDRFSRCIKVEGRTSMTSLPGVFAAGDVIDARYRQAVTAAASGCAAAQDAEGYLAIHRAPEPEAAAARARQARAQSPLV